MDIQEASLRAHLRDHRPALDTAEDSQRFAERFLTMIYEQKASADQWRNREARWRRDSAGRVAGTPAIVTA